MYNRISELIDLVQLQNIMDEFHKITGIPSAIFDPQGSVIIKSGWTEVCNTIHREHPVAKEKCTYNDKYIRRKFEEGQSYALCKCGNGLFVAGAPILANGEYVGGIFLGQLMHENADMNYFIQQAEELGLEPDYYLALLKQTPIISEDKLQVYLRFIVNLAEMLSTLSMKHILQKEAEAQLKDVNSKLETLVAERTSELSEANKRLLLDIEERKKIEENLIRISQAVEGASDAICIADAAGIAIYQNKACSKMFGSSLVGKNILSPPHNGKQNDLWRVIYDTVMDSGSWYGEVEMGATVSKKLHILLRVNAIKDETNKTIGFIGAHTDITQQKKLEREITRLDRLNIVGEMAASIGHEVRNPMQTVRGFLQLVKDAKINLKDHEDYVDLMINELDRANSIITEFLSLAKNKAIELKECKLNNLVKSISMLIEAEALLADKTIRFELAEIPDLLVDEKEIRQLILNLVRNGLEAMESGKTLTIKTSQQDNNVVLVVQDEGKGIEPSILEKLGTPFLTTKEQGTGLGLAVCYSIVARHKALVKVDTSPQGTAFSIVFPIPEYKN